MTLAQESLPSASPIVSEFRSIKFSPNATDSVVDSMHVTLNTTKTDLTTKRSLSRRKRLRQWLGSDRVELLFGGVIIFNGLIIGLQTQLEIYLGEDHILVEICYGIQCFCLLIFVVELLLRLIAEGCGMLYRPPEDDPTNCFKSWRVEGFFDLAVVSVSVADLWVITPLQHMWRMRAEDVGETLQAASTLRILQLVRLARIVRVFRVSRELSLLVMGLAMSLKAVGWVFLMLFLVVYVGAMACSLTLGRTENPDLVDAFGSVSAGIYSHFKIITLEAWPDMCGWAMQENPGWALYFISFIMISNLALVNLITGLIMDGVLQNAADDDWGSELRAVEALPFVEILDDIIAAQDKNCDGYLDEAEFAQLVENSAFQSVLNIYGISLKIDPGDLFQILDVHEQKVLSVMELAGGLLQLRGSRDSLHPLLIRDDLRQAHRKLSNNIDEFRLRITSQYEQEVAKLEDHLGKRLRELERRAAGCGGLATSQLADARDGDDKVEGSGGGSVKGGLPQPAEDMPQQQRQQQQQQQQRNDASSAPSSCFPASACPSVSTFAFAGTSPCEAPEGDCLGPAQCSAPKNKDLLARQRERRAARSLAREQLEAASELRTSASDRVLLLLKQVTAETCAVRDAIERTQHELETSRREERELARQLHRLHHSSSRETQTKDPQSLSVTSEHRGTTSGDSTAPRGTRHRSHSLQLPSIPVLETAAVAGQSGGNLRRKSVPCNAVGVEVSDVESLRAAVLQLPLPKPRKQSTANAIANLKAEAAAVGAAASSAAGPDRESEPGQALQSPRASSAEGPAAVARQDQDQDQDQADQTNQADHQAASPEEQKTPAKGKAKGKGKGKALSKSPSTKSANEATAGTDGAAAATWSHGATEGQGVSGKGADEERETLRSHPGEGSDGAGALGWSKGEGKGKGKSKGKVRQSGKGGKGETIRVSGPQSTVVQQQQQHKQAEYQEEELHRVEEHEPQGQQQQQRQQHQQITQRQQQQQQQRQVRVRQQQQHYQHHQQTEEEGQASDAGPAGAEAEAEAEGEGEGAKRDGSLSPSREELVESAKTLEERRHLLLQQQQEQLQQQRLQRRLQLQQRQQQAQQQQQQQQQQTQQRQQQHQQHQQQHQHQQTQEQQLQEQQLLRQRQQLQQRQQQQQQYLLQQQRQQQLQLQQQQQQRRQGNLPLGSTSTAQAGGAPSSGQETSEARQAQAMAALNSAAAKALAASARSGQPSEEDGFLTATSGTAGTAGTAGARGNGNGQSASAAASSPGKGIFRAKPKAYEPGKGKSSSSIADAIAQASGRSGIAGGGGGRPASAGGKSPGGRAGFLRSGSLSRTK